MNDNVKTNLINEYKISKDIILFLETRVKSLMDEGNYELAYIMATNISKYIGESDKEKVKKKIR